MDRDTAVGRERLELDDVGAGIDRSGDQFPGHPEVAVVVDAGLRDDQCRYLILLAGTPT
jgi:hypothetical protein